MVRLWLGLGLLEVLVLWVGATGWAGLWLHAAVATGLGGLYMAGSGLWFRALGRAVAEVGVGQRRMAR